MSVDTNFKSEEGGDDAEKKSSNFCMKHIFSI